MSLVFVTGNKFKFQEVQSILEPLGIGVWQKKMGLFEPESNSPAEIALEKAKHAFEKTKMPLITEDTGVFFEAFNNFPGTKPKRHFEELGFNGILGKLKGRNRKAFFHTAICFMGYGGEQKVFEAKLHGRITKEVILEESDRMPFEKIFVPEGQHIVLAQMSLQEKNAISHRAQATRALAKFLVTKQLQKAKNEKK